MRKLHLLSLLALAAALVPAANAAHITCNNATGIPNTDLLGYDFTIDVPISQTGGGGVGKATTTAVVILPVDASTVALSQFVAAGKHSSSCTISDTGSSQELVLSEVFFSRLELISTPGKSVSSIQLTLAFSKYAFTSQQ